MCHGELRRLVSREQDGTAFLVSCRFGHLHLQIILVVVVTLEEILYAVASQLCFTLFDRLRIFPLLIVHVILVKVVHVDVWHVL